MWKSDRGAEVHIKFKKKETKLCWFFIWNSGNTFEPLAL